MDAWPPLPPRRAVERLLLIGATVYICPQTLTEFWPVATGRTSANGFGLTPARTADELDRIEGMFPVIEETPEVYSQWRQRVRTAGVSGRQPFDARIAPAGHLPAAVIRCLPRCWLLG